MIGCVVLTGNQGDIGIEIEKILVSSGYLVIGIDNKIKTKSKTQIFHDLSTLNEEKSYINLKKKIFTIIGDKPCVGLINNAAIQILGDIETLKLSEFEKTITVNLTAPLALSKILFRLLEQENGNIINIGSIHANLTKPSFISYATSKSALKGLTKSMAVDFGSKVRVNMISPAAIDTNMLREGFEDNLNNLNDLKNFHPTESIGNPSEIAKLILSIFTNNLSFLNGACIEFDGGISSRLHDPK